MKPVIKKYLHLLPAIYFAAMGMVLLIGDLICHTTGTADVVCAVLLMLPIIFRNKLVYALFGACSTLVWGLFLLQVILWYAGYPESKIATHTYNTTDFIVGFLLCGISAFFSVILLYRSVNWYNPSKPRHVL